MDIISLSNLRNISRGLILILLLQFTLLPARETKAAVPLVLGAAAMFIKTPVGRSFLQSLAVHAAVLSIGFSAVALTAPPTSPSSEFENRIDVKLNPKDPQSTPVGWTAPVAPSIDPTAPINTPTSTLYRTNNFSGTNGTVGSTACITPAGKDTCLAQQRGATTWKVATSTFTFAAAGVGSDCTITTGLRSVCQWQNGNGLTGFLADGSFYTAAFISVLGCLAGYTLTNGSCVKTNEAAIKKPGDTKCEITRVGNTFAKDIRDPDCDVGTIPSQGLSIGPDEIIVTSQTGTDISRIKINPDGTTTVENSRGRTDGSGKTDKTSYGFTSPNGTTGETTVTGYKAEVFEGVGVGTSTTPTQQVSGGGDAKDSSLQQILAEQTRENTTVDADRTAAESAAAGQSADLTGAAAVGQDTVEGLGLPVQGDYIAPDVSGFGNALPSNAGACVTMVLDLPVLGVLNIDPCPVVTVVRPLVDFLTITLGVMGGMFALLGRREEN